MTHVHLQRSLAALVLLATSAMSQGPCPPRGINLTANGGRLGDAWSIDMTAAPSIAGVVAFDISPGPVQTPFGTLCLGLTSLLRVFPIAFNASGQASFGGTMPADASLAGVPIYWSAIAFDATRPN